MKGHDQNEKQWTAKTAKTGVIKRQKTPSREKDVDALFVLFLSSEKTGVSEIAEGLVTLGSYSIVKD